MYVSFLCLSVWSGTARGGRPSQLQTWSTVPVQLSRQSDEGETGRKRENRHGNGDTRVTETNGGRALFTLCKYNLTYDCSYAIKEH